MPNSNGVPAAGFAWGAHNSAMQKLLEIKDGALVQSGIKPSVPDAQNVLWADSSNALFVDNGVEKARGISNNGVMPAPVTGLAQAFINGVKRVWLGTPLQLYKSDDGVTLQLTGGPYTGQRWSMIPWGTWLLATNNVDKVQVCKDTGAAVDLGGVPVTKARIIRKLANRPLIFYGQSAAWPAATDIEDWTPSPETNAGDFFIRDLDSDTIAVEPLGDQLAFYTRNKMGLVTFIGGTSQYGFKVIQTGIGAIGLNAVVPVGFRHYGMSATGIWVTDGSGFDYIDAPDINKFLDEHFSDKSRGDEVVGIHVKDRSMVEWFFPGVGGIIHGFGYNYKTGVWSHLHFPVTAGVTDEVFDNPLAAGGTKWGLLDKTDDITDVAMPSSLTSSGFDAGEPQRYKRWDKVEVYMQDTQGLIEVRFWLHKTERYGADPSDEQTPWITLARENWIQRDSVYLAMELRTTGLATHWRLGGLSVHGELAGWVS